jgi:hypothetical protein
VALRHPRTLTSSSREGSPDREPLCEIRLQVLDNAPNGSRLNAYLNGHVHISFFFFDESRCQKTLDSTWRVLNFGIPPMLGLAQISRQGTANLRFRTAKHHLAELMVLYR